MVNHLYKNTLINESPFPAVKQYLDGEIVVTQSPGPALAPDAAEHNSFQETGIADLHPIQLEKFEQEVKNSYASRQDFSPTFSQAGKLVAFFSRQHYELSPDFLYGTILQDITMHQ